MDTRILKRVLHCLLFDFQVIKFREAFEIGAKMDSIERTFKTSPLELLGILATSKCIQDINSHLLPFNGYSARPAVINGVYGGPSFFNPPGSQQASRNFCCNSWDRPGCFTLLGNKRIHVTLGIGDLLQCHIDDAVASALSIVICIYRAAGSITNNFAVLGTRLFKRCS